MRVLFLNYEYPPLGGGAANATSFILREYARISDLEVDLVTSSTDSEYHLEAVGNNVKIHKLPIGKNESTLHFQSQKELLVYAWRAYQFSKKLIKEKKYDLTHSFFTVPCGAVSWMIWKKYKIPYIISLRGSDVPGYSDRFGFVYKLLSFFIVEIWKKAAAVVSNSQDLKNLALQSKTDQKIDIIFNGIDIECFGPKTELRPLDKFIITTGASRVTHRKGLNYLLEAIAQLILKYPNIYLKIMGDGNARNELIALARKLKIENHVEFLGRIPREKTMPYYQEASLFVLPSLNEGMSNALLEALGAGLPIIATDTGGSKELVREGDNGFIIRMKDSADIADKIKKILDDLTLVEKMGIRSRRLAETMDWSQVADQYFELYKKLNK